MEDFIKKLAHIQACHNCLRREGILFEATYADHKFFNAMEPFFDEYGKEYEPIIINNVNVKDFVAELHKVLNTIREMMIEEIKNKTYFNGKVFIFEQLESTLREYINVVIGQCSSIENYLTLLLEVRKMEKKLISKGKIEDAPKMAKVYDELEDIADVITGLRKGKIKPDANMLLFEIPKSTFDNFEELSLRAWLCYTWLTNSHNHKQPWWVLINNV